MLEFYFFFLFGTNYVILLKRLQSNHTIFRANFANNIALNDI